MNKRQHAKNSVILLEMIINILLFSVLLVVGLTFFIKTHTMTKDTKLLHQAVTCCDNAATVFESSNADPSVFAAQYPDCVISDEKIFIYYDNDFKEEITYRIVGSNEADVTSGRISDVSPVGKALIGHRAGDQVTGVVEESGYAFSYKVLSVTRD